MEVILGKSGSISAYRGSTVVIDSHLFFEGYAFHETTILKPAPQKIYWLIVGCLAHDVRFTCSRK